MLQEHVGVHSRPVGPVPQVICRDAARGHGVECQPRGRRRAARKCVVVRLGSRMRLLRMLDHARKNKLDLTLSSARCRSFRLSRCSKPKFQRAGGGDFWVLQSSSLLLQYSSGVSNSILKIYNRLVPENGNTCNRTSSATVSHTQVQLTIVFFIVYFLQAGSSPKPICLYCRQFCITAMLHLLIASSQRFVAALRETVWWSSAGVPAV